MPCQVKVIDTPEAFKSLQPSWEQAYRADPHAMLFVSWDYLDAWFEITRAHWFVLAVMDTADNEYIGFFPFIRNDRYKGQKRVYTLLTAGIGKLPVYTGFVCYPQRLEEFSGALADYFSGYREWDKIFLSNVFDPKMGQLFSHFGKSRFVVQRNKAIPSLKLELPETYEEYLQKKFGRQSRHQMRSLLRKIENDPELRISSVRRDTLEKDIDVLIRFWRNRWGKEELAEIERQILLRLFEKGRVWLHIIWQHERPVGMLSFITDREKSVVYSHLTAYDADFRDLSPGRTLFIFGLRKAIESGYRYFDFAQGLDGYKLSFKAEQQEVVSYTVFPKNLKSFVLRMIQMLKSLR